MIRIADAAASIQPTLIRQVTDKARPTSIHLGIGQPDLPVSPAALASAMSHLQDGHAPYSPNLGLPESRQAVADRYGVSSSEVMLTCGVQEGLAVALLGCVNPGDRVLVPNPGFPAYDNLVRLAGGIPTPYRLSPVDWQPDVQDVRRQLADASVIIFNTPSNPTGAMIGASGLAELVRAAEAAGVVWISDEIYEDLVYDGAFSSARDHGQDGIVLSGLSKSHAAMGWRIGWLRAPAETIEALKPLHQHLVTSAPVFAQHALVGALAEHDVEVASALNVFRKRRDCFCELLANIPDVHFVMPTGAFYVFLDVRAHMKTTTLTMALDILDACDLVTIPGEGFGDGGMGYLRLAFTRPLDDLREAATRLQSYFEGSSEI